MSPALESVGSNAEKVRSAHPPHSMLALRDSPKLWSSAALQSWLSIL